MTSIRSELHQDRPGLPRLTRGQLLALAAGVLAGLAVWVVGLPDDPVWDTTWSALTVPAALVVGAGVGVVTIAATTRRRWRVVDMTVAAVLAVAGGLLLWGMNTAWTPITEPIGRLYPPLPAVLNGIWLLPGVLAGLVVRRPGAAVLAETVAALIEAQLGGLWGFASVYYGVIEGLGAELVFALLLYRRFGLGAALAAGAGSAVAAVGAGPHLLFHRLPVRAEAGLPRAVRAVRSGDRRRRRVGAHPGAGRDGRARAAGVRPVRRAGVTGRVGGSTVGGSPVAVRARGWGWRHATRRAWALRGLDLDVAAGGAGAAARIERLGQVHLARRPRRPARGGGPGPHDADGRRRRGGGAVAGRRPRRVARQRGVRAGRARTGLLLQDPVAQTVLARCGDDVAFGLENLPCLPARSGRGSRRRCARWRSRTAWVTRPPPCPVASGNGSRSPACSRCARPAAA